MILAAEQKVSAMKNWVSENRQSSLIQSLNAYNSMRNAGAYSQTAKVKNLKELTENISFLKANGIETFEDLQRKLDELNSKIEGFKARSNEKSARLKEIDTLLLWAQHYAENKPVADELAKNKWKAKREKFQSENENALRLYHMAERKLKPYFRTASCRLAHGKPRNCKFRKILKKFKTSFRRCVMMSKGYGISSIRLNKRTIKLRKMNN